MSARWLGDDAYVVSVPRAVSPRVGVLRNVRVLLRVESLGALGRPAGDPVWLRGVARIHPAESDRLDVQWLADDRGQLYELSAEELAP